jgi:hypothetical protein
LFFFFSLFSSPFFFKGSKNADVVFRALAESALGHIQCFAVPETLGVEYFSSVPVLHVERFNVPHMITLERTRVVCSILTFGKEGSDFLFLGDVVCASRSFDVLRCLGITHVVNASNGLARDCFAAVQREKKKKLTKKRKRFNIVLWMWTMLTMKT